MKYLTTRACCTIFSLCLIVSSISEIAFSQSRNINLTDRSAKIDLENRLAQRVGREKAVSLVENYGAAAENVLKLDEELDKIRRRDFKEIDREGIAIAYEGIANFDPTGTKEEGRRQLSGSWRRMAQFTIQLDGPTEQAYEQLKLALELDPENEEIAREVEYQKTRRDAIAARLEAAERYRRGEDPNPSEYIGDNSLNY